MSILLTALVAFGCAKEELAVLETSGNTEVSSGVDMSSINFAIKNGLENWGTKASVVDGFATGDAISVAAFQGTDECFNEAITNTTGGWVMSEGRHYYWESYNAEYNGTDALDFCFVYPEQTISSKSFTYTLGANPASQEDLLVKYLDGTKASADYSPVEVVMDHALSILDFKVKAEESGYEYKVEGITVNNAAGFYDKGTYTFGNGWGSLSKVNSVNSISSPINVATVSSSEYTDVNDGDYCFLLPQDVASMGINVRYSVFKNGTTYTDTKSVSLSDNTFAAGKKYTYNVTLPKLPAMPKLSTPVVWASSLAQKSITFTWTCADANLVQGYDVYYKKDSPPDISSSTDLMITGHPSTTCTITCTPNDHYYIAVVAKPTNTAYDASDAGRADAKSGNNHLATPNITTKDIGTDYIEYSWSSVSGAVKYVLKNMDTGEILPDTDNYTRTSYRWENLDESTEYTIGITAVSSSEQKSATATKTETTKSGSETVGWDSGEIVATSYLGLSDSNLGEEFKKAKNGGYSIIVRITVRNSDKQNSVTIKTGWEGTEIDTVTFAKDNTRNQTLDYTLDKDDVSKFISGDNQFKGLVFNVLNGDSTLQFCNVKILIP